MKKLLYIVSALAIFAACTPKTGEKTTSTVEKVAQVVQAIDRSKAPQPTAAPKLNIKDPATFTLDNGLKVFVVENHKLPTVNANLFLDYQPLLEGDKAGMLEFFGGVMKAGTKNYTKEELDEELDFNGIDLSVGSRSIGFDAMKKRLPKAMELMKEVLFNPTFENADELDKLKKQAITGLESSKKNPDYLMGRVGSALMYGTDHPYGEYATEKTYQNIKLSDLKNHYNTFFKPNIGYLTIVGDVTLAEAKKMANEFAGWKKGEVPTFTYPEPKNVAQTEINIIDLPSATQSNISISNLEDLKLKSDDFFAARLGNSVLGGSSSARLFMNLREDKAYTYGAYSRLGNNRRMRSRFNATSKVRNEVTDSAVMAFYDEINKITTTPASLKEIQEIKNQATGNFALGLERPSTIGNFARTIALQGLDKDFYRNYLKNLNAQTPTSVLTAMKKYIKPNNQRIIIVGKAEQIAPGLKKLGYPVKFFDINGKEVADPTIKANTGDITADQILTKFMDLSGGQAKLEAIKSLNYVYDAEVAGAPMKITTSMKTMAPNKMKMVMDAEGYGQIMKQVFNGETGYVESMGQNVPMEEDQIKESKANNTIAQQLAWINNKDVVLDNIVTINGKKAYKLNKGKNNSAYYDVASGFLVKSETTTEVQGTKMMTIVEYSDYEKIDGMYFAKTMKMDSAGQAITMKLKSVEINKGVTADDFK